MACAPWIQTFSGKKFDFSDIREESICVEDIAHALANMCRYTGHCLEYYSVAQHSIIVSHIVDPMIALEGLLHDAKEAYIGDVSTPLKVFLNDLAFKELDLRIDCAIGNKFHASLAIEHPKVKNADLVALATEVRDLMGPSPFPWMPLPNPIAEVIDPMPPEIAERAFLQRFEECRRA